MDITQLQTEFPDYPVESIPDLSRLAAAGFVDRSWHNDLSPSLECGGVVVWLDYADPAHREIPGGARFVVQTETSEKNFEDWAQAEAAALAECARINSEQ